MSIIIHGPQGCGKTRNAELLRKYYGMNEVVEADDFDPYPLSDKQIAEFKAGKILFLTNIDSESRGYNSHNRRVIPYFVAIKEINRGQTK